MLAHGGLRGCGSSVLPVSARGRRCGDGAALGRELSGAWRSSRLPHKRTRPCLLAKLAATTLAARGGFAGRRGGQEKGRRREKGGVSEPSPSLRSRRRRQPPFFWGRKGIRECCGCVDDFGTARVRGKWPARFDIGLKFWPRQRGKDATAKSVTDI